MSYDNTSAACIDCIALGVNNLLLVGDAASRTITAKVRNGYLLTYSPTQTALIPHKPILNPHLIQCQSARRVGFSNHNGYSNP